MFQLNEKMRHIYRERYFNLSVFKSKISNSKWRARGEEKKRETKEKEGEPESHKEPSRHPPPPTTCHP